MNNKNAFWQALVATVVVFLVGLSLGFFLESSRADNVEANLLNSEIDILDEQLRNRAIGDFNVSCDTASKSLFNFADNIYQEALKLEQYDSATKFTDDFLVLHKRYDLLRTMLWSESIRLRKGCNLDFHTLTYLYNYESEDIDIKAKQIFFSRILLDIKNENPGEILLIPIAGDLGLKSVDLVLDRYEISSEELPAVIVDEENVLHEVLTIEDLEKIIFEANK